MESLRIKKKQKQENINLKSEETFITKSFSSLSIDKYDILDLNLISPKKSWWQKFISGYKKLNAQSVTKKQKLTQSDNINSMLTLNSITSEEPEIKKGINVFYFRQFNM